MLHYEKVDMGIYHPCDVCNLVRTGCVLYDFRLSFRSVRGVFNIRSTAEPDKKTVQRRRASQEARSSVAEVRACHNQFNFGPRTTELLRSTLASVNLFDRAAERTSQRALALTLAPSVRRYGKQINFGCERFGK